MTGDTVNTDSTKLLAIALSVEETTKLRDIVNRHFCVTSMPMSDCIIVNDIIVKLNHALCSDTFLDKGVVWENKEFCDAVRRFKGA
jgi:hypothetical protein